MGGNTHNALILKGDAAAPGLQEAGYGVQCSGLACAVGADQGDDLSLIDLKGDALNGVDAAVIDVEIFYLQHAHAQPSFCLPRYASMTWGLFWISAGVPLAMILP